MKILGLLLVLGIGVFLIWFFEEIFKDSSEEDYEDYVYEMPRKAARDGVRALRPEGRSAYCEVHTARPDVRTMRPAVRTARAAGDSRQAAASGRPLRRAPGAAGISAAEGCPVAARRPVAASCNDRTGQSYRKTA